MQLVKNSYALVRKLPDVEKYALSDQIRRAVISVPANIAEGHGRNSDKEFIKFLGYSKGSLYELETELLACIELEYIKKEEAEETLVLIQELSKMINKLIKRISV